MAHLAFVLRNIAQLLSSLAEAMKNATGPAELYEAQLCSSGTARSAALKVEPSLLDETEKLYEAELHNRPRQQRGAEA